MEHLDKKKSSQEGLIKRSVILLDELSKDI
jgi:hypothetical protein